MKIEITPVSGEFVKLDPKDKKEFVDALRSGEYEQGKHQLRSGEGKYCKYCCFGVYKALHPECKTAKWDDSFIYAKEAPRAFEQEVYLTDYNKSAPLQEILAWYNDNGWIFVEIADWIEENL